MCLHWTIYTLLGGEMDIQIDTVNPIKPNTHMLWIPSDDTSFTWFMRIVSVANAIWWFHFAIEHINYCIFIARYKLIILQLFEGGCLNEKSGSGMEPNGKHEWRCLQLPEDGSG